MTVQYEGRDFYTLFIEDRTLTLSQFEIDEIQSYDFKRGSESLTVSELNDKIEALLEVEQELISALSMIESLEEDVRELTEEIHILGKELEQYD